MTMRWLITGAAGMLGRDLQAALKRDGDDIVAVDLPEIDITDPVAVESLVAKVRPDVLVNCAAFTNVDGCETNEEAATKVNGEAVRYLAESCSRHDALLVQLSTDFVFDGTSRTPYEVNSLPAPLSAYGRSKLRGEQEAARADKQLIVRTAWLFGRQGWNFVEAIKKQIAAGKEELRVVDDQRGRPTYTPHLAAALVRLSRLAARDAAARGIFHYSDSPEATWFDFASAIVRQAGAEVRMIPVTTDEFPRPARRPAYSVLSTQRYEEVTGLSTEPWQDGLREYFASVDS